MNIRLLALTLLLPLPAIADLTAKGQAVIGDDLRQAQQLFRASTSLTRRDCDPVGDGRWICASYTNPILQDFITGTAGLYSGEPTAVIGSTLKLAKQQYSLATILKRVDCDPYAGQWICASFNNPSFNDLTRPGSEIVPNEATADATPVNATPPNNIDEDLTPQRPDSAQQPATNTAPRNLPVKSLFQDGDLISLNYDSCPDPDDLHAAVAGKMVLDHYALQNGSDYIVTNGTCGDLRPRSDYITNSYLVFDELYDTEWNDAFLFEDFTISQVGDYYLKRLEAGQRIWVLDGGPMDFTARVVAYIRGVGTSADLKNITVIQHSHGWNEDHTDPENLRFMEKHVQYLKIDDGNHRGNRTAQLNQSNQQAAFPNVDLALVDRFASDPRYSDAWQLAFKGLSTENRFDGSDTVELLWALGLDSSLIEDWYDFADQFITDEPTEPEATVQAAEETNPIVITDTVSITEPTANPTTDSTSDTNPAIGNDSAADVGAGSNGNRSEIPIEENDTNQTPQQPTASEIPSATTRLEAESAVLGAGWIKETTRGGFSGTGYIRWSEGNRYLSGGDGITQYIVVPEISGIHTLRIRARAINPPKSDLNNDVWIRMNGEQAPGSSDLTDWVKVFTTGQDTWQLGGTVDKAHSKELFKQNLIAGEFYTLEISGRSINYAIDYFEISPSAD